MLGPFYAKNKPINPKIHNDILKTSLTHFTKCFSLQNRQNIVYLSVYQKAAFLLFCYNVFYKTDEFLF